MTISIPGLSDSYKRPVVVAELILGAGPSSTGAGDLTLLLVGMKTSDGTMTPDVDVLGPFTTVEEAMANAGARSQLTQQAKAALVAAPQCKFWLAAVTEPSGGTAATFTLAIGGTWTVGGDIAVRIGGVRYDVSVGPTDTADVVGAALAAKINGDDTGPFTAAYSTGVLTGTCANKGVQGKDWIIFLESDDKPAGMTLTLTGSAAVTGGGVRAGASSSGTGVVDVTAIQAKLQTKVFDRIAVSQNDSANAALWRSFAAAMAAPLKQFYDLIIFGHNNSESSVIALAQTTLNDKFSTVVGMRNGENHPCQYAAAVAAVRSVSEGGEAESGNWIMDADGYVLPGLAPYQKETETDQWSDAEQDILLNAGVTPLVAVNGSVEIVRGVTSYSLLNGTTQDDRCVDWGDVTFPINAIRERQSMYTTVFRVANKFVGPDNADGSPAPPGKGTPSMWSSDSLARDIDYYNIGYLEVDPRTLPPKSEWNNAAKRIMSQSTWIVSRIQHQIGIIGRGQANA